MKQGIDISHHNNITDLSGYDFVLIRAGYGATGTDRKFYDHIDLAMTQGVPFGLYWFLYAKDTNEAYMNALRCVEICAKYKDKMQLPLYSDFEYDSESRYQNVTFTGSKRSAIVNTFNEVIKNAGFKWGTYANVDYLRNKFDRSLQIGSLWLACWSEDYPSQYQPDIWQYTNCLHGEKLDGNYLINSAFLENRGNSDDTDMACYCPYCGNALKIVKA